MANSLLRPDRLSGRARCSAGGTWCSATILSRGLRALAGDDAERLRAMSQYLVGRWGEPATWPRDPEKALLGLDAFVERNLLEEPANRKSVALIFEYAQFLVPTSDLDSLAQGRAARLVRFLSWAQNPLIKRVNIAFVLSSTSWSS